MACYTSADTSNKKVCTPQYDDYFECLHGYKEREKARLMMQQLKENEQTKKGVTATELYKSGNGVYESLKLVE